MAEEIEQLEVKEVPEECPVPPPCPVCPTKPKPWQICLRAFLLSVAGLALAFIILACSGLRITRKESLLDVWLASRKGITPTPEVTEPTPVLDPTSGWKTYRSDKFNFEIDYPVSARVAQNSSELEIVLKGKNDEDYGVILIDYGNSLGVTIPVETWIAKENKRLESRGPMGIGLEHILVDDFLIAGITPVVTIGGSEGTDETTYYLVYKGKVIPIKIVFSSLNPPVEITEWEKLYKQVLSTFKFLDQEQKEPVVISSPDLTGIVQSPLSLKGTVEAGWMFEGVFPVKLLDANKKEIARATAREVIPGSWQSGQPVEFSTTLTFTTQSASGFLVFENDNPSGLPENSKSFEVPVKFQ